MKKIYLVIISCLILFACKDECDHGFETNVNNPDILVGSWYEETTNEEDVFSASGSLFGRFSNTTLVGETYGFYSLDIERNRLTYTFTRTNGATSVMNWKLSNVSRFQYTQTSDFASLTLGKIVDTYQLEVGETRSITFSNDYGYEVLGYESTNARIASVDQDGKVKAEGEKGTAYIKVKTATFNVWIKVVIGESRLDLWFDYPSLFGMTKEEMKQTLGVPTQEFSDGNQCTYTMKWHDYIQQVSVYINDLTKKVDQIHLYLKPDCPIANVESYLSSRYYFMSEDEKEGYRNYSTFPEVFTSKAQVRYYLDGSRIDFYDIKLWDDYTCLFGSSPVTIKSEMEKAGYAFFESYTSYSLNGSDGYTIPNPAIATNVEFAFNPNGVASEFFVYYFCKETEWKLKTAQILAYLDATYQESKEEERGNNFVFYNTNHSLRIILEPNNQYVKYTDLTLEPVAQNLLGNYWEGLGKNRSQLLLQFGFECTAYTNRLVYNVDNEYISQCVFRGTPTEVCSMVVLELNKVVSQDSIVIFLDSQHKRYSGQSQSQYTWTDEEKNLFIIYNESENEVVYQIL